MSEFTFDVIEFDLKLTAIDEAAEIRAVEALGDCAEDLVRISSQIAPIDKNVLRKSWKIHDPKKLATKIVQDVTYSATSVSKGYGRFNYALAMHEWSYTPSQPAGGTDGYTVGNKYLQRPLLGESNKYFDWITEAVKGGIG